LHVGGVDNDVDQEAERVDGNVPLAARYLFARIAAMRVERKAWVYRLTDPRINVMEAAKDRR
jgi:hypothetical protein